MELMSSLLLYALAAALPQALGYSSRHIPDLKLNASLLINQPYTTAHKKILLNIQAPPLVHIASEMQSVFKDITCNNCINCMERAIKAHRKQEHKPHLEELYYDVLNEHHPLYKRGVNGTKSDTKTKSRSKGSKSVTITKMFDDDGKVVALRVKESNKNDTDGKKHSCKMYSVAKSLPCDTFGSDMIIEVPKKKVKRDKKTKHRQTTEKAMSSTPTPYKKRDVENSEVPESYMPSIEDMY